MKPLEKKTLYDVISKFLNNLTPYKEWLEPFLEQSKQVLRYPERPMNWKGFKIKNDQRVNFTWSIQLWDDGKVTGSGKIKKGEYKIVGTHTLYKKINFTETITMGAKSKSVFYKGNFVDSLTVEGSYTFGKVKNKFRIWISDDLCPGLSVIQSDQKKKKVDPLPEEALSWKGYFIQNGEQGDMTGLQILFDKEGKITGKGEDDYGTFSIKGTHRNYSDVSFTKKMEMEDGWVIHYDGQFNGKSLEGLYMVGSESCNDIGKFKLWIEDPRYEVPKEEEVDDDSYPAKPLRWTGYYIQHRDQGPMELFLTIHPDGTIGGQLFYYNADEEEIEVELNGSHENLAKVQWKAGEETYKGQFVEHGIIEGIYSYQDKMGGKFRITMVR